MALSLSRRGNVEPFHAMDVLAEANRLKSLGHPVISMAVGQPSDPAPVAVREAAARALKDGRIEQGNFHNYRVLRMNEAPAIEVHIVESNESPGGMGEPGTSAIVPAVTNAIFAATGKRLRRLPVNPAELKA